VAQESGKHANLKKFNPLALLNRNLADYRLCWSHQDSTFPYGSPSQAKMCRVNPLMTSLHGGCPHQILIGITQLEGAYRAM
jgi:hypothetical protein